MASSLPTPSNPPVKPLRPSSPLYSPTSFDLHPDEVAESASLVNDERAHSSDAQAQRHGSLTFTNGLALVLGLQIGSGIFSAPSQVSNHVASPGIAVLVWLLAGALVWTGAASFIELGQAIPKNGGVQEYLRTCYSEFFGFLFSWVWIAIGKPCGIALTAMIFAENLSVAIMPTGMTSPWQIKVIAIAGLFLVTVINCSGRVAGARAANMFLLFKLLAISSIAIIGMTAGIIRSRQSSQPSGFEWFGKDPNPQRQTMSIWMIVGDYITAIYGALFCYGGWETIGFVAGDMADSRRDLPRVINTAMTVAISGFVLMNIALFTVLPFQLMRDRSVVAVDFGLEIFGTPGGLLYSLVVSASSLGSLNANVFATGRLCVAASKSRYFPKILGNGHCSTRKEDSPFTTNALQSLPGFAVSGMLWFAERTETLRWDKQVPVYAMTMNACIASFYIIIGTFDSLVTFIGISEYIFFLLAVLGIFILRRRENALDRSYRTWTFNPVIFCVFSSLILMRGIVTDPIQGFAVLFLTLVGWAVFKRRFP